MCACSCSVAHPCLNLCVPMDHNTTGFPVLHHLPDFAQTHVCWVGDAIQAISFSVVSFSPWLQSFPASRFFPMSWLFTSDDQILGLPSNEDSGLISFGIDWFYLLAVQGTLNSFLQHHSSKVSIIQCFTFFMVQLPHLYFTIGKTVALTIHIFVGKVMSLLLNILSRFVIAFFLKEHVHFNFMDAYVLEGS